MAHDFKRFPELTNSQMQLYYFASPHKQITEDFRAEVVKVIDGDTIIVKAHFRDFNFPIRFLGTNSPEMNEPQGKECKKWLEDLILNKKVDIMIDKKQRVGKWGRLLGTVFSDGMNLSETMIINGKATPFDDRNEGQIPEVHEWLV